MALDFFAGCLGGCAGVLVGHPFDTIKVCLQTQDFRNPQYKGTLDCLTSIVRKESVSGLYKGMSSPMSGVALVNAIVFGVYGNIQRRLPNPDTYWSHALAGASAGFCQAFICSPMELVKTRIQLQNTSHLYKNPLDCLVKIGKSEGLNGLFRGLGITIVREVPGFGTYFLAYELMTKSSVKDTPPLSTWHMMMAGGLAGTLSWVITYPVDVLKSRIQADGMTGPPKYSGVIDCYRKSVALEGYSFLSRGLTSTILRAFPTNAACFTVVTWVFRWVGEEEATTTYQIISDYTEATNVGSLYEPLKDHIPLQVGTFKDFDAKKQYFGQFFNWRNLLTNDAIANCMARFLEIKETNHIGKYVFHEESLFLSDFEDILYGETEEELVCEQIQQSRAEPKSKEHYLGSEENCTENVCAKQSCLEERFTNEHYEVKVTEGSQAGDDINQSSLHLAEDSVSSSKLA